MGRQAVKYELVIFDFDGTLADSFPLFVRGLNVLAEKHRFRSIDAAEVETLRQYDAKRILDTLGVPLWKVPMIARSFTKYMAKEAGGISLFAGVGTMLQTLSAEGIVLGLITSNTTENVYRIMGEENMALLQHVRCGTSLLGKRFTLQTLLRQMGVNPRKAIYIGDELRDLQAARSAGADFGAVAWGYTDADTLKATAPDLFFTRVEAIAERLLAE